MSLRKNTLANYISQLYAASVGILIVPIYLRIMGLEAYGLVSFYAMMQALFQLLDIGLTPTISREVARFRSGVIDGILLKRLVYLLELVFFTIALIGALGIIFFSGVIAHKWLKVEHLSYTEVQYSIMLMGIIAILRWISGLYKGIIAGYEKFQWLSGYNLIITSFRFIVVLPVLYFINSAPITYFMYQLSIAILEVYLVFAKKNKLLPQIPVNLNFQSWDWNSLRKIFKFSLTLAFTNSVWILVMQTDKIILSKYLPLSEYACYSLVVLIASGITIITTPISSTILPRITSAEALGNEEYLVSIYRKATQAVCFISIPILLIMSCLPKQLLFAWTGNMQIANNGAQLLSVYSIGNGLLGLSAFAYYLQYAKGDLKLHFIGNIGIVVIYIPLLIWSSSKYGMLGAGSAWLLKNLLFFIFWLPLIHFKFAKGLHSKWIINDIIKITIFPLLFAISSIYYFHWSTNRLMVIFQLMVIAIILFLLSLFSISFIRNRILEKCKLICKKFTFLVSRAKS